MSEENGQSIYPAGYIEDGYTREGDIEGDKDFHPPLKFKYRPPLPKEVLYIQRKIGELSSSEDVDESEALCARFMANHLVEWNLKDSNKKVLGISEAILIRIESHLSAKLFRHITGIRQGKKKSQEIQRLQQQEGQEVKN